MTNFKMRPLAKRMLLVAATTWAASSALHAQGMRVMTYNLQNLFDTKDSPDTNDSEFTPNGKQRWTEKVLADKMRNLGEVIRLAQPDVIGVSEVENQEILQRFMNEGLRGQGYQVAYAGPSDDDRGIRCGVISKYPIVDAKTHRVWDDTWAENGQVKKTRDILEVTVRITKGKHAQDVTFLVNHWPSRAGAPAFRDRIRLDTARKLKKIVADIVADEPNSLLVSLGDYNDELKDASFQQGVQPIFDFAAFLKAKAASIFAADAELLNLPEDQRGTFYFARDKVWNELDHVLISEGENILRHKVQSFQYQPGTTKILRSRFVSQGKYPEGCEIFGNQQRVACPNGASDHFPIVADFLVQ